MQYVDFYFFLQIVCLFLSLTHALQLPVADGVLEGRDVAVRVQWDQQQADEHAAADKAGPKAGAHADVPVWAVQGEGAVFRVGCRLWKEDAGPIPPRDGGAEKIVSIVLCHSWCV